MAFPEQDQDASVTRGQSHAPEGMRDLQVTHGHRRSYLWNDVNVLDLGLRRAGANSDIRSALTS